MEYPRVYDQNMQLLAVLENADKVGYVLKSNDLSTATLSLPTPDPKNEYMAAHNIVRIYDGDEEVGLFRIVGAPSSSSAIAGWTEYSLEHVIATLVDDVLFGYHEIGGVGILTRDVANYILARQQTVRWQLGRCDFSDQYAYKFENTNLLAALFSLGNVLTEEYQYEYDTSTTPWTVNIVRADSDTGCEIRYRRNMQEITRSMDASALVTRLYLLGYGEGVNQLTVKGVNGGLPYIEADTVSVWGVKSSVYADTTIEDPETLLARGRAVLKELKNPYMAYTASAVDLYRLTGLQWDKYLPGKLVHVIDEASGVDFTARIVTKTKGDVYGDPGGVELEIANRVRDIADSINRIAERQGIAELYSQGATNLYSQQYADNADANHPAAMRFFVPSGCVRINSVLLSWSLSSFRAYETGAAAGGGSQTTSADGGGSTQTSSAGGATTATSAGGGSTTVTVEGLEESEAGVTGGPLDIHGVSTKNLTGVMCDAQGNEANYVGYGGAHSHTVNSHSHGMVHYHYGPSHRHNMSHTHSLNGHKHSVSVDYVPASVTSGGNSGDTGGSSSSNTGYGGADLTGRPKDGSGDSNIDNTGTASPGTSEASTHTHYAGHYHNMEHVHNVSVVVKIPAQEIAIPSHTHSVTLGSHTHSVDIPSHSHGVSFPDHTHSIVYGIYEGGSAQNVTVRVDGQAVPAEALTANELDVAAYLGKDQDGKITRGTWHQIEIVPDALTRIEANLFVQAFVQSVGGGDY